MHLTNLPALVGIGLAIAKYLLQAPHLCNLVLVARTEAPLLELKEKHGNQVQVVCGDVSDFSLAREAVAQALKSYGRLDGLIINHGVLAPVSRLEQANIREWMKAYDVNFFSALEFVGLFFLSLLQTSCFYSRS